MATDDFFCSRLDAMIDRQHPLAVLTTHMPWRDIEAGRCPPRSWNLKAAVSR